MEIYALLGFVLILSIYLGLELISKVPSTLHTPLMSGANAISGIALVGALVLSTDSNLQSAIAFLAVLFACLLYTSPSPRDLSTSRMPSSA